MFWLLGVLGIGVLGVAVIAPLFMKGFKTSYEERSWEEARFQVASGSSTLTPGLASARSGMSFQERQNFQRQEQAESYF